MNKRYLIVDPCNSATSGITSYSTLLERNLTKLGISAKIFSKHQDEKLSSFRKRLNEYVRINAEEILMIETPESYAAALKLKTAIPIHIRLHSSKTVLNKMIGQKMKFSERLAERKGLRKATVLSAPSCIIAEMTSSNFTASAVNIYPNPVDKFEYRQKAKIIDVLFFGRFIEIKGTKYLHEIISKLDKHTKIVLAGKGAEKFRALSEEFPNVEIVEEVADKKSLISSSKLVMIPSLFESFSMVAAECISLAVPCVMWDKNGILEYVSEDIVRPAKAYDVDSFVRAINRTLLAEKNLDNFKHAHEYIADYFTMGLVNLLNKYTDMKIVLQSKQEYYYALPEQYTEWSYQGQL
jgi:glycosyltransferase involved in cell wall biosynthesis